MGKAAYPTGADLVAYLTAAGFATTFIAALDTTTAALAGAAQFERDADRRMLAVTQTREFDPERVGPRGFLDLRADLATATSVAYGSQSFIVGTDVRLMPLNAVDDGHPYNALSFGYWRRFYAVSYPLLPVLITVIGSWGFGATIPEDAWEGMLAFAGMFLFPQLVQRRTQGMIEWREADMQESYGLNPLLSLRLGWQAVTLATAGGLDDRGTRHYGKYTRVPAAV